MSLEWILHPVMPYVEIAIGLALVLRSSSATSGTSTPTSIAVGRGGQPVDGIHCNIGEQLAYHIHQHLTLYRDGKQVPVPKDIGIPGGDNNPSCYYWIHVHSVAPGIIHVESPTARVYSLGNLFDIWKATRNDAIPRGEGYPDELAAAAARHDVTVFVQGKLWRKGYRNVLLVDHAVITVEIGKPVVRPPPFSDWSEVQ